MFLSVQKWKKVPRSPHLGWGVLCGFCWLLVHHVEFRRRRQFFQRKCQWGHENPRSRTGWFRFRAPGVEEFEKLEGFEEHGRARERARDEHERPRERAENRAGYEAAGSTFSVAGLEELEDLGREQISAGFSAAAGPTVAVVGVEGLGVGRRAESDDRESGAGYAPAGGAFPVPRLKKHVRQRAENRAGYAAAAAGGAFPVAGVEDLVCAAGGQQRHRHRRSLAQSAAVHARPPSQRNHGDRAPFHRGRNSSKWAGSAAAEISVERHRRVFSVERHAKK